jgi:hypothetical protein
LQLVEDFARCHPMIVQRLSNSWWLRVKAGVRRK